jgi:hypothetical protein
LNQVKRRHIRFLVDFTICRSEEKGLNRFLLKKLKRARSARPTQASAGLAQLARTRAGASGSNRLTSGARWSAAGATEPLRSDAIRRIKSESTNQVHCLRATGPGQTETLGGSGRRGCSPRGVPRRRGRDGATRRSTTTPGMVNIDELGAKRQICTPAVEELDWGL